MIKKVILLALLCSILSGCFKDKENWETVKLYQVGQDCYLIVHQVVTDWTIHYNSTTTMIKY